MSSGLNITIDSKSLERFMAKAPGATRKAIGFSLRQSVLLVQNTAKRKAPHMRGDLRRSITHKINGIKSAKVGTNKVYAAIQEFGGIIRPKKGPYLWFKIKGKLVRAKQVKIPAHPYMRPAVKENVSKINKVFKRNIEHYLKKI